MSIMLDHAVYIQVAHKVLERHRIWDSRVTRDEPYGYRLMGNMLLHPCPQGESRISPSIASVALISSLVKKRK